MGAIFGARFWPVPGASVPLFTASGNHGLSGTAHADLTNWPQDVAVSSSGGRYANDLYCCVNGTTATNYGERLVRLRRGARALLRTHVGLGGHESGHRERLCERLRGAFRAGHARVHSGCSPTSSRTRQGSSSRSRTIPFYSDDKSQGSDTFIDGPNSLEGLFASYGVNIAFNGHSHVYERNVPSAPGLPVHLHLGRRRRHAGTDRAVPQLRCLRPRLVARRSSRGRVAALPHRPHPPRRSSTSSR